MDNNIVLTMNNITKTFPGVKALDNVNFSLKKGEIHALLGENGAGKSTLIKVLAGIYQADSGNIIINGNKVSIDSVTDASRYGISVIHQELVLVRDMTVAENIFLGREPMGKLFVNRMKMLVDAQKLLDEFNTGIKADTLIKELPIAKQQMVEIIKAISFKAQILVMDEPTSSISDKEVNFLFDIMRDLAERGVSIIYISHKMSELEEICDRVTILRDGQYVSTEEVKTTSKDKLIALMVGRDLKSYYPREYGFEKEVILRCENINDGKMVFDGTFDVKKGEIVGFAGLVGAGRSELMKCIFGLTKEYKGDIFIKGKKVKIKSPLDAIKFGIGLVPENRKEEGLYKIQSVRYNTTIEVLEEFIKGIVVSGKKEEEITNKYIDIMNTKTPSIEQQIMYLSGGNQQKVMISRWLATEPDILILDEPTRGVDVGAKAEIYGIINELAKKGIGVIMISSELPEIINMSDRIYVMEHGKVVGEFSHDNVTQESIMQLAAK